MFKVGDRVRCIDASFKYESRINTLKMGGEYIVHDIKQCSCGSIELNVGAITGGGIDGWCCSRGCGRVDYVEYTSWYSSRRFVKVQEDYIAVTVQVEKEEPILN